MSQPTIAPCPFCGSPKVSAIQIDKDQWSVSCDQCLACGSSMPTEKTAIAAWQGVALKVGVKAVKTEGRTTENLSSLQKVLHKVA